MALGSQELNYSDHWAKWSLLGGVLRTKLLLMTFYDSLIGLRHFKNVRSHVFWNLKKRKIRILEHWYELQCCQLFTLRQKYTQTDRALLSRAMFCVTIDGRVANCVWILCDGRAGPVDRRKCDQRARPSMNFVDKACGDRCAVAKYWVWDKVTEGRSIVPLLLEIPEFPYNTV